MASINSNVIDNGTIVSTFNGVLIDPESGSAYSGNSDELTEVTRMQTNVTDHGQIVQTVNIVLIDPATGEPYKVAAPEQGSALVQTVPGTTYDLAADDDGHYIRLTNAAAKTVNVRTNAAHALPENGEWHFRNVGVGTATIAPAGGVTVNAPSFGGLVVPSGGTVTLRRVGENEFDLIGFTVVS